MLGFQRLTMQEKETSAPARKDSETQLAEDAKHEGMPPIVFVLLGSMILIIVLAVVFN